MCANEKVKEILAQWDKNRWMLVEKKKKKHPKRQSIEEAAR